MQWKIGVMTALAAVCPISVALVGMGISVAQESPSYRGAVDICARTRLAGWAVRNGVGVPVDVIVNGKKATVLQPNAPRPDLVKWNLVRSPEKTGFDYTFSRPFQPTDRVELVFSGGTQQLQSSPCK